MPADIIQFEGLEEGLKCDVPVEEVEDKEQASVNVLGVWCYARLSRVLSCCSLTLSAH